MGQASKGATKRIFLLPYSSCCRRRATVGAAGAASTTPVSRRQSRHTANVVSCCCLSLANFGPWLYLVLAHCSSLGSPLLQRRKLRPAPSDSIGTLLEFKAYVPTQKSNTTRLNAGLCPAQHCNWFWLVPLLILTFANCFLLGSPLLQRRKLRPAPRV